MSVLLQVDFPFEGPFGEERLSDMQVALARSIAEEPGMIWKIWTENGETKEAGGVYLFDNRQNAEAYLAMHQKRLEGMGVSNIRARFFNINRTLTLIDQFPESALEMSAK